MRTALTTISVAALLAVGAGSAAARPADVPIPRNDAPPPAQTDVPTARTDAAQGLVIVLVMTDIGRQPEGRDQAVLDICRRRVDPRIATFRPPGLLQSLKKCGNIGLCYYVALS